MRSTARVLAALTALTLLGIAGGTAASEESEVQIGYYAFKPSFVSNISGGPKYIRCDIQLMTEAASEIPKIELHAPALRHAILMLISAQDGRALLTREGKEALRKSALASVQQQLEELTGASIVKDLYFTAYYVK